MPVLHREGDDARRAGGHERFGEGARRECPLKDVALRRDLVRSERGDVAETHRELHQAHRSLRELFGAQHSPPGEALDVRHDRTRPALTEAGQPVLDVGEEALARLFAVVADVDPTIALQSDDGRRRLLDRSGELVGIDVLSARATRVKRDEPLRARQAPGVRRQESAVAPEHPPDSTRSVGRGMLSDVSAPREWPFTGRADELALVLESLRDGRSVVLGGTAGVGKSRLQREATAVLESDGKLVRRAVATISSSVIPLGALASVLPERVGSEDSLGMLQWAIRELAAEPPRRTTLTIDDAHLLDELSATVVHHLAATGRCVVLLTLRSGETAPDAIASLWREGLAERIDVQTLSRAETDALIIRAFDGPVATSTITRLRETSGGNPLFLRELILGGQDAGSLVRGDGGWTLTGESTTPVLHDVLMSRLVGLPDDHRRALELLALVERLDLGTFQELSGAEVVADLERRGLIVEARCEHLLDVLFAHPIYGEILRAEIAPADARAARTALVDRLSTEATTGVQLVRLAAMHLESGDHDRPELLREAATYANQMTDWALAERLALAAHGIEPTLDSALPLATAYRWQGLTQECIDVGTPFLGRPNSDARDCELAIDVAVAYLIGPGDASTAERILREAAELTADDGLRQRLLATRTHVLGLLGRSDEALKTSLAALADEELDGVAVLTHLTTAGRALIATGRVEDALALIDEHLHAGGADAQGIELADAMGTRMLGMVFAGKVDQCLTELGAFHRFSVETGNDMLRVMTSSGLAMLYAFVGRPVTAIDHANDVLPRWTRRGYAGSRDWQAAMFAESLALLARSAEASEAIRYASGGPADPSVFHISEITRCRAWVLYADGRHAQARVEAVRAANQARSNNRPIFELLALYDAVRLGSDEVAGQVAELASSVQGKLSAAIGAHAAGIRDADAAALEDASRQLEEAGRILCAAEAATQAAAAYDREGLRARAAAASERSRQLAERCEGAHTPILSAGTKDPLTKREREVAELASRGLTNKEIADRLVTSIRTVEGHLYQVYAKLGVSSRADLVELLVR